MQVCPRTDTRGSDEIRHRGRSGALYNVAHYPPGPRDLISAKVHQTVDSQDANSVKVPSKTHSPIERLPPSPIITAGLQTRGDVPVASGGMGDIWRGEYRGKQVAIKAFRIYPTQNSEDAKEVRI